MDDHKDCIPRPEAQQLVRDLGDTMRREFTAAITTVQVQIGATEKVLSERIKGAIKWAACAVGVGQVVAALVAIQFGHTPAPVQSALHFFGL